LKLGIQKKLGKDIPDRKALSDCGIGHDHLSLPNAVTDRCGRSVTSELETDAGRSRSVQ
jgi:hypothetical protein